MFLAKIISYTSLSASDFTITGGPLEDFNGNGHTYVTIIYFVFAFANWGAPSVVSFCGPIRTLLIGINSVYLPIYLPSTGKSVSEALILESVNPQYEDRLFIDLQLLTQKNTNSEHVLNAKTKTKNNFCTQQVLNLYFSW